MSEYYAKSDGKTTVRMHTDDVSRLAGVYGREIGMENLAATAGMFHDIVKYGDVFAGVLSHVRTGVDHAASGALLFDMLTKGKFRYLSEVIAAHHGGLRRYEYLKPYFDRFVRTGIFDSPSGKLPGVVSKQDSRTILSRFRSDRPDYKLPDLELFDCDLSNWKGKLHYMQQVRFLLSCLADADYTGSYLEEMGLPVLSIAEPPIQPEACLERLRTYRNRIIGNSTASDAKNALRNMVYADCTIAGQDLSHEFFKLTAPTGSGKTLGMLRFALERCRLDVSKKRIIIVLPFLSISDQVAKIVQEIIPGAIVDNSQTDLSDEERIMAETYAAPCIVTTTVQFFGSLFSDRPVDCRKLHRFANSVILFDEIQALPAVLSRALMQSLHYLSERFHSCICLSTATQPAYSALPGLDFHATEIILNVNACFAMAPSTPIRFDASLKSLSDVACASAKYDNTCVIVNLKSHASSIYATWMAAGLPNCFLLSTDLCSSHRLDTLMEIQALQARGEPVHVVSTQCIEAGVDLDFEQVFRALAPLPSMLQAAGRQNRNGCYASGHVIIFEPEEKHRYPGTDYERQAVLAKSLFAEGVDLNSLAGIDIYYGRLFEYLTYSEPYAHSLSIMDFHQFAQDMRLIDDSGYRVIVPYKLGPYQTVLAAVESNQVSKRHLRETASITVPVYDRGDWQVYCKELLIQNRQNGIEYRTGVYILLEACADCYDKCTGLRFMGDPYML